MVPDRLPSQPDLTKKNVSIFMSSLSSTYFDKMGYAGASLANLVQITERIEYGLKTGKIKNY